MPDCGFGRCDGHHEMSISGSKKTHPTAPPPPFFLLAAAFARRAGYIRCDDQGLPFSSTGSGACGTPPWWRGAVGRVDAPCLCNWDPFPEMGPLVPGLRSTRVRVYVLSGMLPSRFRIITFLWFF
jgi:hypothetical protein